MRSAQLIARLRRRDRADSPKLFSIHRHAAGDVVDLTVPLIKSDGGMAIGAPARQGRNSLFRLSLPAG